MSDIITHLKAIDILLCLGIAVYAFDHNHPFVGWWMVTCIALTVAGYAVK